MWDAEDLKRKEQVEPCMMCGKQYKNHILSICPECEQSEKYKEVEKYEQDYMNATGEYMSFMDALSLNNCLSKEWFNWFRHLDDEPEPKQEPEKESKEKSDRISMSINFR